MLTCALTLRRPSVKRPQPWFMCPVHVSGLGAWRLSVCEPAVAKFHSECCHHKLSCPPVRNSGLSRGSKAQNLFVRFSLTRGEVPEDCSKTIRTSVAVSLLK